MWLQICDCLDAAATKKGKLTGDALRPRIERVRVSNLQQVFWPHSLQSRNNESRSVECMV